jgi:hypothetical protein
LQGYPTQELGAGAVPSRRAFLVHDGVAPARLHKIVSPTDIPANETIVLTPRYPVKPLLAVLAFAALSATSFPASAQFPGYVPRRVAPPPAEVNGANGRAPWQAQWQYDSGSDNDRRPELPYYQQGGGQQTGGPARNLLPTDNLHFAPR